MKSSKFNSQIGTLAFVAVLLALTVCRIAAGDTQQTWNMRDVVRMHFQLSRFAINELNLDQLRRITEEALKREEAKELAADARSLLTENLKRIKLLQQAKKLANNCPEQGIDKFADRLNFSKTSLSSSYATNVCLLEAGKLPTVALGKEISPALLQASNQWTIDERADAAERGLRATLYAIRELRGKTALQAELTRAYAVEGSYDQQVFDTDACVKRQSKLSSHSHLTPEQICSDPWMHLAYGSFQALLYEIVKMDESLREILVKIREDFRGIIEQGDENARQNLIKYDVIESHNQIKFVPEPEMLKAFSSWGSSVVPWGMGVTTPFENRYGSEDKPELIKRGPPPIWFVNLSVPPPLTKKDVKQSLKEASDILEDRQNWLEGLERQVLEQQVDLQVAMHIQEPLKSIRIAQAELLNSQNYPILLRYYPDEMLKAHLELQGPTALLCDSLALRSRQEANRDWLGQKLPYAGVYVASLSLTNALSFPGAVIAGGGLAAVGAINGYVPAMLEEVHSKRAAIGIGKMYINLENSNVTVTDAFRASTRAQKEARDALISGVATVIPSKWVGIADAARPFVTSGATPKIIKTSGQPYGGNGRTPQSLESFCAGDSNDSTENSQLLNLMCGQNIFSRRPSYTPQ